MPVSNLQILSVLLAYRECLVKLLKLNPEDIMVASEYSFITVNITQCYIRFTITDAGAELESIYSDDKAIEAAFKEKIESETWPGLKSMKIQLPWSKQVIQQLETADNIASIAMNCVAGDEYRPGNFSKILLNHNFIELHQVNYMNAKSLNHKNNYSLRSLVFRISLEKATKMITEFTDRSSQNNRHCGEKIRAAIDWTPE